MRDGRYGADQNARMHESLFASRCAVSNYYNREAIALWEKYAEGNPDWQWMSRMPMLRPEFVMRPDILFVGVNPSFSEDAAKKFDRKHSFDGSVIRWDAGSTNEDVAKRVKLLVDAERTAREDYRVYYAQFERFQDQVKEGCSTEHLDVFLLRHTSQSEVLGSLWASPKVKRGEERPPKQLSDFGAALFRLFLDTLQCLQPKTVLVANARAAEIATKTLALETKDGRVYRSKAVPDVAFFLSGMLSGAGAMDNHSKARLAADIRDELTRLTALSLS